MSAIIAASLETSIADSIKRGADLQYQERSWGFDRSKYANASEIDTCIRKQVYAKQHPDQEEDRGRGYANRGHAIEEWAIRCMISANVPIKYALASQVSLQDEATKISATPDGIFDWGDVWEPFDVKSIDPRTNKKNLPKKKHVTQLQIGMALINKYIKPDGVKLSKGRLIYIDASDFDDIIEFEVEIDEGILEAKKKRASKILRTKNIDNLDREGRTQGGRECDRECGFKALCGVSMEKATSRKRANRSSNLDASAQQYMDLKDKMASDKAIQDEVKETIKQELKSRGKSKVIVGDIEIDLQQTAGRESLDKKAMKADGIDLDPYTKTGKPSERLVVQRV